VLTVQPWDCLKCCGWDRPDGKSLRLFCLNAYLQKCAARTALRLSKILCLTNYLPSETNFYFVSRQNPYKIKQMATFRSPNRLVPLQITRHHLQTSRCKVHKNSYKME